MKLRLLSVLLVFLLVSSAFVSAVSAEPASAGARIAFDVVKDVLSPITEKIPLILKEQQIDLLNNNREQAIKELSDYRACLKDVERKCLQNKDEIIADYNKIIEKRKTSKIHNHPFVKIREEREIKKRLKENIENYTLVLNYIDGLEHRISGLDKLIEKEEQRYQDMDEDTMKGHEIMKRVKNLEEENKQLKEQNSRIYSVLKEIIRDNETMLAMLEDNKC